MGEYHRCRSAVFHPQQKHVGQRLRVMINYVDGQGNMEVLRSPASNPVQNVNDKPTGSPILSGTAMEGDALVVDTSTIYDEDGMGLTMSSGSAPPPKPNGRPTPMQRRRFFVSARRM